MADVADKAKSWAELIREARQILDPYAWAKMFRDSYKSYQGDKANDKFIGGCRQLAEALGRLELNPSTFLYAVDQTPIEDLSDEQLESPENLAHISRYIRPYEDDFTQVVDALKPVRDHAYVEIGECVIELSKGLTVRYELLRRLESAIAEPAKPGDIRKIAKEFHRLIDGMEPVREEIRRFVAEHG